MGFRLTYSTMFNPPEAMHEQFEAALARVSESLPGRHALFVGGLDRDAAVHDERYAPFDSTLCLGSFARPARADCDAAMRAAADAGFAWRHVAASERARLVRGIGDLLEARVYEIAAALVLEVGKNRMEALGEVQETADLFRHYADDFERHAGYAHALPDDPIDGVMSHNASVMRPYGVWVVIAPFNYPAALSGGPVAAALVTGNTVVLKGSVDTPWAGRLLADCIRDAGLPPGVFNYVSGGDGEIGETLVTHPLAAGVTFTGSVRVGRHLVQYLSNGATPRPCIAEMGGKNPCIVTGRANLDDAAAGIVRSAYGMTGQKCSSLSRLYVQQDVAEALIDKLKRQIGELGIGDPRQRDRWMGPVINHAAYANFQRYVDELAAGGSTVLAGGHRIGQRTSGPQDLARGWFVEPTLVEAPAAHPLWKHEMFLPILLVQRFGHRDEAMRLANDTDMGLTAGFYGAPDEVPWFHDNIEAGVTYANRPQGATTGSWPGYQPFVGWKSSSSTGKAIASFYYLAQYMREQSRTVVE